MLTLEVDEYGNILRSVAALGACAMERARSADAVAARQAVSAEGRRAFSLTVRGY